jgi:renalase
LGNLPSPRQGTAGLQPGSCRYASVVSDVTLRIAVIGAGLAGLTCAHELRRAGAFVDVYEASGAIGGRLATHRLSGVRVDHGAQYLTARDQGFRDYLQQLADLGYVKSWEPEIAGVGGEAGSSMLTWYVGTPGMASIVRPLCESVQVFTKRPVHTIMRSGGGWTICFEDEATAGPYAMVAIAVPAPKAQYLFGPVNDLAHAVSQVRMAPCWSLMLSLEADTLPRFDVYSDMSQTIRWIGRDSSKPGRRSRGETVVVHASQAWSRETQFEDPDLVADELWSEVCHLLGLPPAQPQEMQAYLWEHALVDRPLGETYMLSSDYGVGVAGDWCAGRLSEHAFMSGQRLGRAMISSFR